ncbi:hypothetical protein [Sporosarcina sp. Te-1]|uniref:hypothetical protein n=1 Tax=Sporosarcina sp. Te-1 TaxID=2818390 RepID=UPI001A9E8B52|nr:hypothetical protein [Sporosarcina sp. Te-1]QTD42557.1 hypothetical protein J3U78_07050 [Sporosarcina sp. Te-1]
MGLFMNGRQHPQMFTTTTALHEPNQDHYRYDPLTEWQTNQRKIEEAMRDRVVQLEVDLSKQQKKQSNRWLSVSHRLEELEEQQYSKAAFEENVMERLDKIEKQNQILQQSLLSKEKEQEELIRQIMSIHRANNELTLNLQDTKKLHDVLLTKIEEQQRDQHRVADALEKQTAAQLEMSSRLDRHESILEKLVRQMDHLRSIIYERSHDLAEKIEKGYIITTQYAIKRKSSPTKHSGEKL